MQKREIVQNILVRARKINNETINLASGSAWAPANLALCKYWGKRDAELNLPMTPSLSISLGNKGTFTRITHYQSDCVEHDVYVLNGQEVAACSNFARRLREYLDLFRYYAQSSHPSTRVHYVVETESTVPVAAGLASSASGFAALIQALNQLYAWGLSKKDLSILARLGSGSACRSLWSGFVEWQCGEMEDGMDCYAQPLPIIWPELRIGALMISAQEKAISSREAMQRTISESIFYKMWPQQVEHDFAAIKQAITDKDFVSLGETAEHNALVMHSLMFSTQPPIVYTQPATLAAMQRVWDLRRAGIPVFFTQDAGPNLQLLFLATNESTIKKAFPEIEVIQPFVDINAVSTMKHSSEQLILVDENDESIGSGEKQTVHLYGQLHRAFSIFIFKKTATGNAELLLQQRSDRKYHSANLWTNTCCGHPRPGEDTVVAAKRRLYEEMGIDNFELQEIGAFRYHAELAQGNLRLIEHEIDHVFVGEWNDNLAANSIIKPNVEEVQNYCWIDVEFLLHDLMVNSQKYTVWLLPALKKCIEFLDDNLRK